MSHSSCDTHTKKHLFTSVRPEVTGPPVKADDLAHCFVSLTVIQTSAVSRQADGVFLLGGIVQASADTLL